MLKFKRLYIDRLGYGPNPDELRGGITMESETSEITVKLTPARAAQMVSLVADQVVENAQALGAVLKNQITNPARLLEGETNAVTD